MISTVHVIGLGKVGELVARLANDAGFEVRGFDGQDRSALGLPFPTGTVDAHDRSSIADALAGADAVISCLPYHLNLPIAEVAREKQVHYFDLTEDVPTTTRVRQMAESGTDVVLAPQCGLAPGLIGIVGASLTAQFAQVRSIELKVGALPQNPVGLLGYAFNWSAEGVVNEYLNDCEVVRAGVRQFVPAMTDLERVVIGGNEFEAALTSGGLGTMCETYEGEVQRLDYKTLRYPGHFEQMRFFFDELGLRDRRELAGQLLVDAKAPVDSDVVYLHAAVGGVLRDDAPDAPGQPFRKEYVRAYYPQEIDGRTWRAISWTTAASAVAVVEMVRAGTLPPRGFIRQESICFEQFLATTNGARFAGLDTP